MTINEYQILAARTINKENTQDEILRHALYAIPSEAGEITGLYQKELQGHPLQREKLVEEIGDLFWALAELCTINGISMDEAARANIDKLLDRYPNGFDPERSLHREAEQ